MLHRFAKAKVGPGLLTVVLIHTFNTDPSRCEPAEGSPHAHATNRE